MTQSPAIFIDNEQVHRADTCEPLSIAIAKGEINAHMWARGAYPGNRLPQDAVKEVCSIGVWDAARDQEWGLGWHRNEGLEITYLDQGSLDFAVDGVIETRLAPGNLTITRPWQSHRVGLPRVGPSRLYWIILDLGVRQPHTPWRWPDWLLLAPEDLAELTNRLRGNEQPVWQADREIGICFRKWWDVLRDGTQGPMESRLKVHINDLFLNLLELVRKSETPLNPALASARRTVQFFLSQLPKHLAYPWTLEAMAKQCGMARSQFAVHCRSITNRTPMAYLATCRIDAARELLLKEPKSTITDIAGRLGFQTSQYFATQFRKKTRVSPVEYRKRVLV